MAQTKRDTPIIHTLILRVSPAVNPLEMSNEYIEEPGKCKIIFTYFWWIIFMLVVLSKFMLLDEGTYQS